MATENICATSFFDENEVFMPNENENNNENNNEKLPLALFQDIEIELREMLLANQEMKQMAQYNS